MIGRSDSRQEPLMKMPNFLISIKQERMALVMGVRPLRGSTSGMHRAQHSPKQKDKGLNYARDKELIITRLR